jgi:hypothetical protein
MDLEIIYKHELEKMLVDTVRQRKTERQRRWREKKHNGPVVAYPIDTGETRNEFLISFWQTLVVSLSIFVSVLFVSRPSTVESLSKLT